MKNKVIISIILVLTLLCVPCLVSLAEDSSDDIPEVSSSSELESESDTEVNGSASSENDSDFSEDESNEETESESSSSHSKRPASSSGHRFHGDPIQDKTPQFFDLKLGDCDPDDGRDFRLKPKKNGKNLEVTIQNSEAEDMDGDDNFYIDFGDCEFWLPIEIPASCVEDDHINSKLVVSYGPVRNSVIEKINSSVRSLHIIQTFSLAMTSYNIKGQPTPLNTFQGKTKIKYDVNAACINQYKRDRKLALLFYDPKTRSLEDVDYELDTENGVMTVYAENSGNFFIIDSSHIDLSSPIKLNSHSPFLKVFLYCGTFLSIAVSMVLIIYLIVKGRGKRKASVRSKALKNGGDFE